MWYQGEIQALNGTIRKLETLGVEKIYLVGGVPQFSPSLPQRLLTAKQDISEIDFIRNPQTVITNQDENLQTAIANTKAIFLNVIEFLCPESECKATHNFDNTVYPLAWDYGHLTEGGAVYVARQLSYLIEHEWAVWQSNAIK